MRDYLLICKIAWSFHKTTRLPFEELLSEATLAYLEAFSKYDPMKGKLSTYMYHVVQNALKTYSSKEIMYNERKFSVEVREYAGRNAMQANGHMHKDIELLTDAIKEIPDYEFFTEIMDTDIKHIVNLIANSEFDYGQLLPKFARGYLVKSLRSEGWSWSRIWNNVRKMKLCINEIHI